MTILSRANLGTDMSVCLEERLVKSGIAADKNPLTVCFVCTGNTCRSPMAEAVTNQMGAVPEFCTACPPELLRKRKIMAFSAGIAAMEGMPISQNAVRALENGGIRAMPNNNYPAHTAHQIRESDFLTCDLVIGISASHTMALMTAFPQYASKITCLAENIPDPFGGTLEDYEKCLETIRAAVGKMLFGDENV